MQFSPLAWKVALVVVAGCGGTPDGSQSHSGSSNASSASASSEPTPANKNDNLLERMRARPVSGYVMVSKKTKLMSKAVPGEAPRPEQSNGQAYALRVLEDRGDTIQVSTHLDSSLSASAADRDYEIVAYVSRSALLPVLVESKSQEFDDGTKMLLRRGLVVNLGPTGFTPAIEGLATLTQIENDAVAFSFEPSPLPMQTFAPIGESIECSGQHVLPTKALHKKRQREYQKKHPKDRLAIPRQYSEHSDCDIRRTGYLGAARDTMVVVGGQSFDAPLLPDPCNALVPVHQLKKGELLADLELGQALIRARLKRRDLRPAGGCGETGGRFLTAKGEIQAFFPDGSKAGRHLPKAQPTKLYAPSVSGDLTCFRVSYLTVLLCHMSADLQRL